MILSFAVPGYIYAFSIIAFFENYGTAFSILTFFFGENNYNFFIPKMKRTAARTYEKLEKSNIVLFALKHF